MTKSPVRDVTSLLTSRPIASSEMLAIAPNEFPEPKQLKLYSHGRRSSMPASLLIVTMPVTPTVQQLLFPATIQSRIGQHGQRSGSEEAWNLTPCRMTVHLPAVAQPAEAIATKQPKLCTPSAFDILKNSFFFLNFDCMTSRYLLITPRRTPIYIVGTLRAGQKMSKVVQGYD